MARPLKPTWTTTAFTAGLIAGGTFAAFEVLTSAAQSGVDGLWMPLRMAAAMILGPRALRSADPALNTIMTGLLIHMLLSVTFAFNFMAFAQPQATESWRRGLPIASTFFGLGLWIVNFYVIAPALGWYWFPDQSNPLIQSLAHTFFYGSVLGMHLRRHLLATEIPIIE